MRHKMFPKLRRSWLIFGVLAAFLPTMTMATDGSKSNTGSYAGIEKRQIKALSAERMDGLLTGKGIGYALAAELNHYPGPRHAIDFSMELSLTAEQEQKVMGLFQAMQAEAVHLGKQIVDAERSLDRAFADQTITPESLKKITGDIAVMEGRLRAVHLLAHLKMTKILTSSQIADYDRLRGYDNGEGGVMMEPSDTMGHGSHHRMSH